MGWLIAGTTVVRAFLPDVLVIHLIHPQGLIEGMQAGWVCIGTDGASFIHNRQRARSLRRIRGSEPDSVRNITLRILDAAEQKVATDPLAVGMLQCTSPTGHVTR